MLLAAIVVVAGLVISLALVRHSRSRRVDGYEATEEAAAVVPTAAATEEVVHAAEARAA
jgi:hypothetical protein